jgi:hypothetical protein
MGYADKKDWTNGRKWSIIVGFVDFHFPGITVIYN